MARRQRPTPTRAKRESQRSRKGCPECRSRKIKCDEQKPECGQCRRAGRECRIIDSLFKPHSLSFVTQSSPSSRPDGTIVSPNDQGSTGWTEPPQEGSINQLAENGDKHQPGQNVPAISPRQLDQQALHTRAEVRLSLINDFHQTVKDSDEITTPERTELQTPVDLRPCSRSYHSSEYGGEADPLPRLSVHDGLVSSPNLSGEDSYQDRLEIAFFLRHFCESPGRWMDICCGQGSYFSENIVMLAQWSPLVRYAACALAAKQLGQVKDPESQIPQTNGQRSMLKELIDSDLGFTWYGAKYYEKAIQILAKQISKRERTTCSLSPHCIYGSSLTPQSCDYNLPDGDHSAPFQIIAASILCQYEDISATMRAWSGHLDGIYRLLRPHITDSISFRASTHIPEPMRALDAVFWFFVLHDMLNAYVSNRKTRIDPTDRLLWCEMGLRFDEACHPIPEHEHPREAHSGVASFKVLLWIMCRLVNADLHDTVQWSRLNEDLERWKKATMPPFSFTPITLPPVAAPQRVPDSRIFCTETWFPSDLSAITVAFYHMAQIIILIHRPVEMFLQQSHDKPDLLATYHTLRLELRHQTSKIIPIMNGMPSSVVRKFMLQPLYVCGRCLTDETERRALLEMLQAIEGDLGIFTEYRRQDLSEEWEIPLDD